MPWIQRDMSKPSTDATRVSFVPPGANCIIEAGGFDALIWPLCFRLWMVRSGVDTVFVDCQTAPRLTTTETDGYKVQDTPCSAEYS